MVGLKEPQLLSSLVPRQTRRLTLRRFSATDYEAYAAFHARPDVYRFLYRDPPDEEEMREQFEEAVVSRVVKEEDSFHFAVERQADGKLIGEVLLKLASDEALQAELGYVINPAFAGQGYGREAAAGVVDLGFRHLGLHRIFARLDTRNSSSANLLEQLGFRREAHLIENERFKGVWRDEYVYALLAREWLSRFSTDSSA